MWKWRDCEVRLVVVHTKFEGTGAVTTVTADCSLNSQHGEYAVVTAHGEYAVVTASARAFTSVSSV